MQVLVLIQNSFLPPRRQCIYIRYLSDLDFDLLSPHYGGIKQSLEHLFTQPPWGVRLSLTPLQINTSSSKALCFLPLGKKEILERTRTKLIIQLINTAESDFQPFLVCTLSSISTEMQISV